MAKISASDSEIKYSHTWSNNQKGHGGDRRHPTSKTLSIRSARIGIPVFVEIRAMSWAVKSLDEVASSTEHEGEKRHAPDRPKEN